MLVFRLGQTYEFFLGPDPGKKLVRVEILESVDEPQTFRARVWLQNTYNLYPTFLNLGPQGEDLARLHSSDQLDTEITTLMAAGPEWITGIRASSEKDFFEMVRSRIISWFSEVGD